MGMIYSIEDPDMLIKHFNPKKLQPLISTRFLNFIA